ncbi:hypothetical protein PROFUN_16822, partial [Planoprotostelium fungivorum]
TQGHHTTQACPYLPLIQGDRVITTNEINKINMDTPTDSKKYNKWTFQLQKAIQPRTSGNMYSLGSLYKGIARYGAQEINHAELRGILRAITHTGAAPNLTIYSDSFNSVLFCDKGRLQKEKPLQTQKNGNTKNKQRFGKRYREIEKGNEEADRLASIAYIGENITSTPDYTLETGDQHSLPKKKEPYSNLITKIMTGTIWTNKRKKQYNLTEDSCKFCSDIMEESIMDSHQHTLGECIFTRELNDQLWATLKRFWDKRVNSAPPVDSGTPHLPSLPLSTCAQMSRRIAIVPQFTYISFATFFLGLPTGLQSSKLSVGQQWLSSP